ncbi:IS3 family transposase [Yersinia pestis]|uniref:IS3 family transposase n=1 Tax=Yersinia pestis TaxID=632 RepID=UPI0030840925
MTVALKEGFTLNHKTVRKLMNQHGLLSLIRRKNIAPIGPMVAGHPIIYWLVILHPKSVD